MKPLIICLALSVILPTAGKNLYVRPSGGTGAGTSWTAAFSGLTGIQWASVQPGDTVFVAGGTYSGTVIGWLRSKRLLKPARGGSP